MIDEEEIYRHQQEQDYPLEPDLLKKLPNLTANQLEKIKLYDEKNTKFKYPKYLYLGRFRMNWMKSWTEKGRVLV